MEYIVTVPIANDLPALSVVRMTITTDYGQDDAEWHAVFRAESEGYEIDPNRAITVDLD